MFKRHEGSLKMSFCVRSIRIFSKFSGDPYYEPLSWFMINSNPTLRLKPLLEIKVQKKKKKMEKCGIFTKC